MPHVVLKGDVEEINLAEILSPLVEESGEWLIKVEEIYVERQGRKALLWTVVVEEGHSQSFYIRISKSEADRKLTVHLDPSTDPIKTRGVKRSVALVAEFLLGQQPSWAVERNNVSGFLVKRD
ncbi:MAG TPA: hypothetical protein PK878_19640 [bacterium]|nr:hypothetical protein [Candidatus Omnitrophota bacterium]HOJ62498.1 hypothetical protein [bacterium]HOL94670.1 hypothetical protein [bacterium]HPP02173.1 hypothetical protein [bacterium]HXK93249.1 hypothetical protein [bacterium]